MANKIFYGLKNVYTASVTIGTTGAVTFGNPVALPGGVSLTLDAEGEESKFYADNTVYYIVNSNNGYSGTLELAYIPESFRTAYLGETLDTKGNLVERSTDAQNYFALLFQFEADVQNRRFCLYYCKASRPTIEGSTVEASIEPKTVSLSFSAIPLPDSGVIKSESGASSSNYTTWFSTVTVPTFSS